MFDIDIYSYQKQPLVCSGKYEIFPLDDKGLKKYCFDKESTNITYVNKLNPILLKRLYGDYYMKILNNDQDKNISKNSEKINENNNEEIQIKNNNLQEEEKKQIKNDNINNNQEHNLFSNKLKKNYTNLVLKKNQKNKLKNNVLHHSQSCFNINNNFYKNENINNSLEYNPLINKKNNNIFKKFHRKMTYQDIFGYPKPVNLKTRGNRYNHKISLLKNNVDSTIQDEQERSKSLSKPQTFFINKIPRNDNLNKKFSDKFDYFTTVLNKSINVNHSGLLNKQEEETLIEKNNYFKDIILNQTNPKFLKKSKLPDIRKVANSFNKIRIIKEGLTKNMGEKYNPYLYVKDKLIKGRNYIGGVFQQ